jgi:hypothetical protein
MFYAYTIHGIAKLQNTLRFMKKNAYRVSR